MHSTPSVRPSLNRSSPGSLPSLHFKSLHRSLAALLGSHCIRTLPTRILWYCKAQANVGQAFRTGVHSIVVRTGTRYPRLGPLQSRVPSSTSLSTTLSPPQLPQVYYVVSHCHFQTNFPDRPSVFPFTTTSTFHSFESSDSVSFDTVHSFT